MALTRSCDRKSHSDAGEKSETAQRSRRKSKGSKEAREKNPKTHGRNRPNVEKRGREEIPRTPVYHRKSKPKNEWNYIIPEDSWFPGKITTNVAKNVLSNFTSMFDEGQRAILARTCFSHFIECSEIILQPQLIHYLLMREVKQPNPNEMWFKVANRYLRFSLCEFCLVTGLRCVGDDFRKDIDKVPSRIKDTYFGHLKLVTNEDVRDVFLNVSDIDDHDVVRIGILYLITSYLFSTSYKRAVENYLFALVEDFDLMARFPFGKDLFQMSLKSLKEGLGHRNPHYRLKGFLVAFQVWIYESIPGLNGPVTNRMGISFPRIVNWRSEKQPSAVKLDEDVFSKNDLEICCIVPSAMEMEAPYMYGVLYTEPQQPRVHGAQKSKGAGHASTSAGTPQTRLLMITDGRNVHSSDVDEDDDDFVVPPPKKQRTPTFSVSSNEQQATHDDNPRGPHASDSHSPSGGQAVIENVNTKPQASEIPIPSPPMSTHSHDAPQSDVFELLKDLNGKMAEMQSKNAELNMHLNDVKSQVMSLEADRKNKLNQIVRMQGEIKCDMIDIRSNMTFLLDSVTGLVSSTMDAILEKLKQKNDGNSDAIEEQPPETVTTLDQHVDKKGKGKLDTAGVFLLSQLKSLLGPTHLIKVNNND